MTAPVIYSIAVLPRGLAAPSARYPPLLPGQPIRAWGAVVDVTLPAEK